MSVRVDILAARIYTQIIARQWPNVITDKDNPFTSVLLSWSADDLARIAWEAAAEFHNESQLRDPVTGQLKHAGLPADVADAIEAEVVE